MEASFIYPASWHSLQTITSPHSHHSAPFPFPFIYFHVFQFITAHGTILPRCPSSKSNSHWSKIRTGPRTTSTDNLKNKLSSGPSATSLALLRNMNQTREYKNKVTAASRRGMWGRRRAYLPAEYRCGCGLIREKGEVGRKLG